MPSKIFSTKTMQKKEIEKQYQNIYYRFKLEKPLSLSPTYTNNITENSLKANNNNL
jgi:hypothetical protein